VSEATSAREEESPPPAKKGKKRRGTAAAKASERSAPEGWPAFARDFPADAELTRLVEAFERGEYALVREAAPRLANSTEDDDVRRAARELRRRLDPDPLAVYLLGVAAALLVFLAYWFWTHPHEGL
jgi:hypothetical protein